MTALPVPTALALLAWLSAPAPPVAAAHRVRAVGPVGEHPRDRAGPSVMTWPHVRGPPDRR